MSQQNHLTLAKTHIEVNGKAIATPKEAREDEANND